MHSPLPLADIEQRQRALDATQSFIVQAPAGSGKTELLVQRYLLLLSRVQVPEAIIAITFTRKAANEMRLRIIHALELANSTQTPTTQDTPRYQLAKKVLAHDQALAWNLLANPNRLRILTIDSFCQSLTRQMPLLSTLGEKLTPIDNPEWLYRLAVQELLIHLEDKLPWQNALTHLLAHLDNNFQQVEYLLSQMLARREQWLHYLLQHPQNLRQHLEQGLQAINQVWVTQLNQLIPEPLCQELYRLLNFSHHQLNKLALKRIGDLTFWQAATTLLLTEGNEWRKQLRNSEGFPPISAIKNKVEKQHYSALRDQALALIASLSQQERVKESLITLKTAPPLHYTDAQWKILNTLFELLPVLVAHLKIIFQQQQKVDYTEILLAAVAALGQPENPSDLALYLDYQIEHLLIDEFQDTSSTQLYLIEKLTAGWQSQDGRTLFLVGDPMQSIYRFRKAEVGLFRQVQLAGLGAIRLQALTLSVNFRSNRGLVDWINNSFSQLLPTVENMELGAIGYSPATAYSQQSTQDTVSHYWQIESDATSAQLSEAKQIIEIIHQIKRQDPQSSVVILVRARKHLAAILPALSAATISYQAIEIDSLAEKSAVQDLLALTRALLHLGDRISWLALLRSPFCGLSLTDLHQITQFSDENCPVDSIWQQLLHFEAISLSKAAKQRLRRIVPILEYSLSQQGRLPLTRWIKDTWLNLGGPTSLHSWEEIHHIDAFLNFLEKKVIHEGENIDFFNYQEELAKIYTQNPAKSAAVVEIMTIHKAKGLEYDHVIFPGLHRKGSSDPAPLLLYRETVPTQQKNNFLLAPIKASHEEQDLIYNYLFNEEKKKNEYELTRLLYVASTRAKKSLHLLGTLSYDDAGAIKIPSSLSLLKHLWPVININREEVVTHPIPNPGKIFPAKRLLKRLKMDWQSPAVPVMNSSLAATPFSYHWTLDSARVVGTVIHRLLYQISQDGLEVWNSEKINSTQVIFPQLLAQHGLLAFQEAEALLKITTCLQTILADDRGRWILSQQHHAAQSELALTALLNGKIQRLIIDRTFIDPSSGIRWIIDYKTSSYLGNNPQEFLNTAMQQHKEQLETYARAFLLDPKLTTNQTIHLGLYFPLTALWCAWEFTDQCKLEVRREPEKLLLTSNPLKTILIDKI